MHDIEGEAWASPLVADGKVYLGTRAGIFYVFAATAEKKLLSTIKWGTLSAQPPQQPTACFLSPR